jgi:hypothetical protein
MQHTFLRRFRPLAPIAALIVAAGVAACDDFLAAENPGAIEAQDLNKPDYVNLIANGVVGEFQFANAHATWWNALFTDEIYNRNTPADEILIDRRDVRIDNGTYSFFFYGNIHRARFLADDAVERLKVILGDTASRDLRVARSLAYGGMSYVYIAEALCESPIDLSAPLSPDTIFARGIVRFNEAIAVANAAKTFALAQPTPLTAMALSADSLKNFALVGAARAYLNMNNKAKAIEYALQVPANFVFRAYYSENSTREFNYTATRIGTVNGGNVGTMLNTPFDTIGRECIMRPGLPDSLAPYDATKGDPRVPRRGGAPSVTNAIPFAPSSYSVYIGDDLSKTVAARIAGVAFFRGNSVRIASGLEARYIVAEAQGPTQATLDFVNERRAAGLRPAVTLAGDALMEELREQRARDFYLDNHRIGDLRRYKRFYGVDKFQKGAYPTSTTGDVYMDNISCWPLPIGEINDNPNIPKPYTSPGV